MDKTCLQILAEVTEEPIEFIEEFSKKPFQELFCTIPGAIEALKIFGRQCFEAGRTINQRGNDFIWNDFDEYFSSLEKEVSK